MSILKYDRVILTKELDKMVNIGEAYEVAIVNEDSFLMRDARTKVAMGVISLEEFYNHFRKPEDIKGWTPWVKFTDKDGDAAFYKTNFRKVMVKCGNTKAVASCNMAEDDFNLHFGIRIAYGRCINKMLKKEKEECEKRLKDIQSEMKDNLVLMRNMIASLERKEEK